MIGVWPQGGKARRGKKKEYCWLNSWLSYGGEKFLVYKDKKSQSLYLPAIGYILIVKGSVVV